MKEELILQKLIKNILKVDIFNTRRQREIVDGRKIFASILYDRGLGLTQIGRTMKKNHATILHYIRDNEMLLLMDKHYKANYDSIALALETQLYDRDIGVLSKEELIVEIQNLRNENNRLRSKNLKIINERR